MHAWPPCVVWYLMLETRCSAIQSTDARAERAAQIKHHRSHGGCVFNDDEKKIALIAPLDA